MEKRRGGGLGEKERMNGVGGEGEKRIIVEEESVGEEERMRGRIGEERIRRGREEKRRHEEGERRRGHDVE